MSDPFASVAGYRDAIRKGDRRAIARTITLLESTRDDLAMQGQEILEELNREGTTVVMVTHDGGLAERTQRIVRLFDGRQVN